MSKRVIGSGQWKLARYKQNWRDICAILPKYLGDGTNGTVIYYTDGSTEVVGRRLVWVLDDLLAYLCTDKRLLHQKAVASLEQQESYRVPLVVNRQLCLVPIKGRKRISKYDSQVGYAVLHHIESIQAAADGTLVQFNSGQSITALDSMRTLKKNLQLTEELKSRCMDEKV